MAKIRVTKGTVGFYADGRHKTKTASDEAFECEEAQAAYFVELGVAEYVDEQCVFIAAPAAGEDAPVDQEPEEDTLVAEHLETMTNKQLANLAADLGVDVSRCKKKADYITAILAEGIEIVDEDDGDELPQLSAIDPE